MKNERNLENILKEINTSLIDSKKSLVVKLDLESIDRKNTGLVYVTCDRVNCVYYVNNHCGQEYIMISNGKCADYEKI